jgi:kinesin family protein 13
MSGNKTTITNPDDGSTKDFNFDHSFWSFSGYNEQDDGYLKCNPSASGPKYDDQEHVYNELGMEVLNNAWEGFHSCLFAYGQTGSGKSYSMIGYGTNRGIVPLATEEIFKRIDSNDDASKRFEGMSTHLMHHLNQKLAIFL